MKNYLYTFEIKKRGGKEVAWQDWTDREFNPSGYIEFVLREALIKANCGWDDLQYKVIQYPDGFRTNYMVLCVEGNPERWIPIEGNSRGANLEALAKNIW